MKNNKPIHFLIFKIIGAIAIVVAVFGIVLLVRGFGDFESNNFMIGAFIFPVSIFVGVACLVKGFSPLITKLSIKSAKYVQNENKDDLKDIASTAADVMSDAATTTAKAVKDGLSDTVYCKYCGKQIDADAKFCSACGKEL